MILRVNNRARAPCQACPVWTRSGSFNPRGIRRWPCIFPFPLALLPSTYPVPRCVRFGSLFPSRRNANTIENRTIEGPVALFLLFGGLAGLNKTEGTILYYKDPSCRRHSSCVLFSFQLILDQDLIYNLYGSNSRRVASHNLYRSAVFITELQAGPDHQQKTAAQWTTQQTKKAMLPTINNHSRNSTSHILWTYLTAQALVFLFSFSLFLRHKSMSGRRVPQHFRLNDPSTIGRGS